MKVIPATLTLGFGAVWLRAARVENSTGDQNATPLAQLRRLERAPSWPTCGTAATPPPGQLLIIMIIINEPK